MTALSQDMAAELRGRIAELEEQLQSRTAQRDQAIAGQAAAHRELVRLGVALDAARDTQNASADILRTIASTPGDATRSLQQIAETSGRLFGAPSVSIQLAENGQWGEAYRFGTSARHIRSTVPLARITVGGQNMPGQVITRNEQINIPDLDHVDPAMADWPGLPLARAAGTRTMCGTPLRREGKAIGALIIYRDRLLPFTPEELALQQSFADQAVIAIENARLFNETREALERQTATADILKVIASSPSDVQPVFSAIAASSNRLLGGFSTAVFQFEAGAAHLAAFTPTNPAADEHLKSTFPMPVADFEPFRQTQSGEIVQIADIEELPELRIRDIGRLRGFRSMLLAPLMNNGEPIGLISVTRSTPGAFAEQHVQLLRTFADQAVIAIENVRLFEQVRARTRELTELLEQQTATSEVLSVISSSGGDLAPVFDAMLGKAMQLCGADFGVLNTYDDGQFETAATRGLPPAYDAYRRSHPLNYGPGTAPLRLLHGEPFVELIDLLESDAYRAGEPNRRALVDLGGARALLAVPLVKDERVVGSVMIFRQEKRRFSGKQIALLKQFAAQAVIAIENTRLLRELRASTEDLRESLQQQTATADVLKVISRSAFDLDSVMNTLTHSAAELCKAELNALYLREGDVLVARGVADADPAQADFLRRTPLPADSSTYIGRTLLAGAIRNIADVENESEIGSLRRFSEVLDFKSILFVPLLREGRGIGVFALARKRKQQFSEREVELVQTFADQAVIAIENARLFDEVQAKTRDLTEALERQTATTEVLSVISRSPSDLRPVLEAISETAARLCGSEQTMFFRFDGEVFRILASWNFPPEVHEMLERRPLRPGHPSAVGRAGASLKPVCIPDVLADPHYGLTSEQNRARYRTTLAVPLMRDGRLIGAFSLNRSEPNSFTDKHIELVAMFADQAVIAIENTRLFDEVEAKTRELSETLTYQTGSANILRVIASSPTNVEPALKAIVESACELCDAYDAAVVLRDGDDLRFSAHHGPIPIGLDKWPINRGWAAGRAFIDQTPIHVDDLSDERHTDFPDGRELAIRMGHRTILSVPLLRDRESIGAIVLRRKEVHPFTEKQITLLQTFADQAVIAIGNVRLFEQVQARTRELATSLEELRSAQDRLVQTEKLASLGQLTAGIAHEIKNPLNFVNNFAALSAELTDELNEVLARASLAETIRGEVDELTGLLRDNLQKIVQHGRRADSIVKNMLLHSREGSGEHRPTDVNVLVEESLNLAYHGARAEKPQFNVTLKRELDPAAGTAELFPQEITRVLLNLITNGFYAVVKRGNDNGEAFEPVLSASTRDRGAHVEIRIRDNGTGIPPEVREKMFNPFFTTKPAGEGTGLGLSMSHDIIVKQHGGTIDVDTAPGEFTEFTIVLPRKSNFSDKSRGQP